ncbi:hypothetical protein GGE45_005432 [Rhizobium aethiopicum]|uniref:hypothetical protein n=1 Tax=Rhizobium aethiopicum TaxID=1138170 RepID=UPI00161A7A23|nr:hypothetical protein [Rhizobium aethiopicum]MBB4583068.1 hypothetical protein [Rhizobium aethiopicum]
MAMSTAAYSTGEIALAPLRQDNIRRVINPSRHSWHQSFLEKIAELTRLQPNWNGYGARAVGFHAGNFAVSMVASACPHYVSEPQVVPGENGDLQVEWHSLEYDIELHVIAPFEVIATRHSGDVCEEVNLSNDFTLVARWLDEMESAIAARVAAA